MYSVGTNPSGVLSGLTKKASPHGKGLAMQAAAGLNLDREQKSQDLALKQSQEDSQYRQQQAQTSAQKATNASQERVAAGNLANRAGVFETGMQWDYRNMGRRRELDLQQMLLNGLARDF